MGGLIAAAIMLATVYALALAQKIIYRLWWNFRLSYSMSFSEMTAFEGGCITITEKLSNNKRLPLPWVVVNYKIPSAFTYVDGQNRKIIFGEYRELLYAIGIKKTILKKSKVICGRRGVYQLTDFALSSNNPLMTDFMRMELGFHYTLTVYPKLVDYGEFEILCKKMSGDLLAKRFINPDPFTFKGIREYQPYDNFRQINFMATAKTGRLMSNIYDFTVSQEVTIILNLQEYNEYYKRDFVHEDAIRLAAFFCRHHARDGVQVNLICPSPDGKPVKTGGVSSDIHLEKIYTALAGINLNGSICPVTQFIPSYAGQTVILISSYHGNDLLEKFNEIKENANVVWIIPKCSRDEVTASGEGIFEWEAGKDA
jgi:uncharacterized protein (DUF58 family)